MVDPTTTITTDLTPGQMMALLRAEGEAAYARGSLCHKLAGAIEHLVLGDVPADAVASFIDGHADLLAIALPDADELHMPTPEATDAQA